MRPSQLEFSELSQIAKNVDAHADTVQSSYYDCQPEEKARKRQQSRPSRVGSGEVEDDGGKESG
jgi:hypothetical protein